MTFMESNSNMINGYEKFISGHTQALKANSDLIVKTLNELTKKKLSEKNKKTLRSLGRSLKKINSNLENL